METAATGSELDPVGWTGDHVSLSASRLMSRLSGLALHERVKVDIVDMTRSQHGVRVLDFVFRQLVFGSAQFVARSEIPRATAQRSDALLRDAGLLYTARPARGRQGGVYVFAELIAIVEGRSLR